MGSYRAVYRAKCDELPCGVKVLHPTLINPRDHGRQKIVEQFEQECKFLSSIRNPHIVQYLGVSRDPETKLPVLPGITAWKSDPDSWKNQKSLLYHTQVNLYHAYLHSNSIIHCDLSSNNVLLIANSIAKVTDFGMSKFANASHYMTPLTCNVSGYYS